MSRKKSIHQLQNVVNRYKSVKKRYKIDGRQVYTIEIFEGKRLI